MKNFISVRGKKWRIFSENEKRIILKPHQSKEGLALKKWREETAKISQREAAEKFGISQTHLAKMELGDRDVTAEILKEISACTAAPMKSAAGCSRASSKETVGGPPSE